MVQLSSVLTEKNHNALVNRKCLISLYTVYIYVTSPSICIYKPFLESWEMGFSHKIPYNFILFQVYDQSS